MKRVQADRLLDYLRANPGATSLDVTRACLIVNVTGRISDLRARGHRIDCRRIDGMDRHYVVAQPRRPLSGTSVRAFSILASAPVWVTRRYPNASAPVWVTPRYPNASAPISGIQQGFCL